MMKNRQRVRLISDDCAFEGTIVCVFTKLRGGMRYVVEDDRGLLTIMSERQLEVIENDDAAVHDDLDF
jgi:hypothetical protein